MKAFIAPFGKANEFVKVYVLFSGKEMQLFIFYFYLICILLVIFQLIFVLS